MRSPCEPAGSRGRPPGRPTPPHTLVLMGLLGAGMAAAQLAMAPLPNIEPVSFLILLFARVYGWQTLFAVAVFVLLEGLVFGFSLWWVAYLYVWAVAVLLAVLFRRMEGALGWAILSGFYGLCFGSLCALVYLPIGGVTLYVTTLLSGIPFDLLHCAGNFALMLLLYRPCNAVLQRLTGGG